MKYRIEQITEYLDKYSEDYCFSIREYASPQGEYHNEAVVFGTLASNAIGIIFEDMPINPVIYYNKNEVKTMLERLNNKAKRILCQMKK